ncbi:PGN_0703 family putative restriction endonuclease [Phycicoccus avicenniae]|uniref:PGN_0703 family putative restriction endonuclease n=1 Tax=Phycicoccus avicenniae TaxID=2828860 RepID=UPI003D28C22C
MVDDEVLRTHQAYYRGDRTEWQRTARLLQSLWRERKGLAPGGSEPHAGSTLAAHETPEVTGSAFVSEDAFAAARKAVETRQRGAVIQQDRLFRNLLSSQPLCFNLFGRLSEHLDERASAALARVWPDIATVTGIHYEWSPGRKDPRFLANGTAFDVYVEYDAVDESKRFLGIEVKYHENLEVSPPTVGDRPKEVFAASGTFADGSFPEMSTGLNAQLLLDHLLALSMNESPDVPREGRFVLLYPAQNTAVDRVVSTYAPLVVDGSFLPTTLEAVVAALREEYDEPWVDELESRYLGTPDVGTIGRG